LVGYRRQLRDDFAGISQALAIKNGLDLVKKYAKDNDKSYDSVFLYRPDLVLRRPIKFSSYSLDAVTCNQMPAPMDGDFHFFVPWKFVHGFSRLFDSIDRGHFQDVHYWIRRYLENDIRVNLQKDEVQAGLDQEVARKVMSSFSR
jgi:hypothetical protein